MQQRLLNSIELPALRVDVYTAISDAFRMRNQPDLTISKLQIPTEVTDDQLAELQAGCHHLVLKGGELGAIASDIVRISAQLRELSERAHNALRSL